MKMTPEELKAKLDAHKLWLETRWSDEVKGERLNLTDADLTGANLTDANLTGANLTDANLARADLTDANLARADLTDADLTAADLTLTNLTGANLTRARLDYSAWPLRCGSLNVKIDKRLAAQLMYHSMRAMQSCGDDADIAAVLANPECVALANQFHRVNKCGRLEVLSSEREADKQ